MHKANIFIQLSKRILYYYPFTLTGTVLLGFSTLLIIDALSNLNPYSFVLALSGFILLLTTALVSRLQALNAKELPCEWDSSGALYAGNEDQQHVLYCEGMKTLPFFRLHFLLKGRFFVSAKESFLFYREFSTSHPEKLELSLTFPLSGSLQASGFLIIKDILGLSRARFKGLMQRTLLVRPRLMEWGKEPPLLTMDGLEDTIRKKDTSEERYYQREYMAGDKLRDINWKVSERLATLITKVSHITQENTRMLTVFFRNYRKKTRESVESIVHLDVLKGWLLSFVKTIKEKYPDYNFEIITGQDKTVIETHEDIEHLSIAFSTLTYCDDSNHSPLPHPGEVFIFSTPFDTQLSRLVADLRESQVHIFLTTTASTREKADKQIDDMTVCLMRPLLSSPLPGFWILQREKKPATFAFYKADNVYVHKKEVTVEIL
jgi:hypothetical protein